MSYMPPPPVKTRQILERRRRDRRRHLAKGAALGLLAVVVVALLIVGVCFLRSCVAALQGGTGGGFTRDPADPRWAHEVSAFSLRPAPWFIDLDDQRLYLGQDNARRGVGYPTYPLDTLSAHDLRTKEQAWQWPLDRELNSFGIAGPTLLGFRRYLSEPPRLELITFRAADGEPSWRVTIEDGDEGALVANDKAVVLGYRRVEAPDDFRLAGYNAESGAKAWGMKLPMRGLDLSLDLDQPTGGLVLSIKDGVVAYFRGNVAGLVSAGSGQRMQEYTTKGHVHRLELDSDSRICYVLSAGDQVRTYLLEALPYEGGAGRSMYRFDCVDDEILLLASGGYVLLSYAVQEAGPEEPVTKLVCFEGSREEPVLAHQFAEGRVSDVTHLPGTAADFLVALNRGQEASRLPVGWGALYRVRLAESVVEEATRFKHPILLLAPFKGDCLVLLRGGEIWSFVAQANAAQRVKRTAHPLLWSVPSGTGERLMVTSYPEAYAHDKPGSPMQVIIFD